MTDYTGMKKADIARAIMNANPDKPMADVVAIMLPYFNNAGQARGYYREMALKGAATGNYVTGTRTPKEPTVKAEKIKKIKVPTPKVQGDKPIVKDKTVEEIADIRAKNLARLKAVGKKYSNQADGKKGGFTKKQAAEAKAYVEAVTESMDNFIAPSILSKEEVVALV